eukprot:Protomagalhaensia_wolfi_Nauph_80__1381@NODE_1828_length_1319_cov_31_292969_g1428_i0_p4_GENE_NODE_1828_length_1319_cov_31_292969_g1428_i0NODE_1828_length_1319_cov_31_292969_g1428_i0_p4_ORF_typecomplete_len104_score2_02DUF723/PF05265_13/0_066_NODE_1828_length_1319_cov_31_292969_g1428_i0374685
MDYIQSWHAMSYVQTGTRLLGKSDELIFILEHLKFGLYRLVSFKGLWHPQSLDCPLHSIGCLAPKVRSEQFLPQEPAEIDPSFDWHSHYQSLLHIGKSRGSLV